MADKKIQLQDATGTNNLYPIGAFPGIDTGNVIASYNQSEVSTYTATQDGWFVGYANGFTYPIFIDGVQFGNGGTVQIVAVPIKKGQVITSGQFIYGFKIFGFKY